MQKLCYLNHAGWAPAQGPTKPHQEILGFAIFAVCLARVGHHGRLSRQYTFLTLLITAITLPLLPSFFLLSTINTHGLLHTMSDPFQAARTAIDECHKKDPAYIARTSAASSDTSKDAKTKVDELAYADGMEYWASHLIGLRLETPEFHAFAAEVSPSPTSDVQSISRTGELLRIAARCQHLERFLTPRASYPEGKAGYLKWRRDLYKIQADRAKQLLLEAGVDETDADWIHKWVSKTELNPGKDTGDMGTQLLEDAAVLVFLQKELELFAGQHQEYTEQKFVDIIKKTWRKLSPLGKQEALKLSMPKGLEPIVLKGIAAMEAATAPVASELQQQQQQG